ncbi:KilA-N domain-containing protein [Bombella sp. TMW 2.2559]|uniref:KilA-N domain-containing protein n=1 Tax=Bombella dulcis TaxID=2967339 RepID=A0ABT3WGR9_9PROT|nr:KilA-N domain-containing protein [Bombella dulcis]MCX5616997.1 KilA-N domain-containing protein [Bombella dulcis]
MSNTTTLTIASTKINQDAEGRFCLNDCHRAAGGENGKRPSLWLTNKQTKELVREIAENSQSKNSCFGDFQPVSTVTGGNAPGTYVCKELVYAYAMWISPSFNLTVIRAFDDLVQGKMSRTKNMDTTLPLRRARLAFSAALRFNKQMGMEVGQARLKALATAKAQTGIDVAKAYGWEAVSQPAPVQARTLNATEIGQHFGTNARGANLLLKSSGYQTDSRDAKGRIVWTPTEKGRAYARLEDQTKAHAEGTVQQWRWYPSVLDALEGEGGVA